MTKISEKKQLILQRLCISAAIVILLLSIIAACFIGASDIYYYKAKQYLQLKPSNQNLSTAYAYANKAHQLYPLSSTYIELMANIKILQAVRLDSEAGKHELLQSAKQLYYQALSKSPYWVYSWLGIVETKILLQEYDQELEQALLRSMEYGYYETAVQHQLITQALPSLKAFSKPVQIKLLKLYKTALKSHNHHKKYIALGKAQNIFAMHCLLPDANEYHPSVQKSCAEIFPKNTK